MSAKSPESCFVYRNMNKDDVLSTSILAILQNGIRLTKDNLEESFVTINKNFKYSLKLKVMEAVENGIINLVYSPPKVRIPTALPFFLTKDSTGRVIAFVVVDLYGRMDEESGSVTIDAKKLYTIMESALLAVAYHNHTREISKRSIVITSGASIYSNMFTRVLNKKYALNVDKGKMQKVLFLAGKFYMINVLGLEDNEITLNYALKNCTNGNVFQLKEINDMIPVESYTDLSTFVQALSSHDTGFGFKDLTVRGYLELFITMYDGSALFALEIFPYFLYNIMSVVNGAYLNKHHMLEDIVDKDGVRIYTDLLDFVR